MRYNIALVPNQKDRGAFENLSQSYFANIHAGYLLGKGSIPHITLGQFECEESELPEILAQFHAEFGKSSCTPEFSGLSILKLGGDLSELQTVELSALRNPDIMDLHLRAVGLIQKTGRKTFTAAGDFYRPHLTLAFINPTKEPSATVPLSLPEDIFEKKPFEVVIGAADKLWQFNNIIGDKTTEELQETGPSLQGSAAAEAAPPSDAGFWKAEGKAPGDGQEQPGNASEHAAKLF